MVFTGSSYLGSGLSIRADLALRPKLHGLAGRRLPAETAYITVNPDWRVEDVTGLVNPFSPPLHRGHAQRPYFVTGRR